MLINTNTAQTTAAQSASAKTDATASAQAQRQSVLAPLVEDVRVTLSNEARKASLSLNTLSRITRSQASEQSKAMARQRLEQLKERVRLMRQLMIGMTPAQKKAMAPQLKEMAR